MRGSGTGSTSLSVSPASGMTLVSSPFGVPTQVIDACGSRSTMALAVAISGDVCPAVPPPASTMLVTGQSSLVAAMTEVMRGRDFLLGRDAR